MKTKSSLIRIAIFLSLILAVGTVGYVVIERWSFLDALRPIHIVTCAEA